MDDIADAKVKAKIENAQAKVKARLEEREVKGSTKRKSEETLPRPTENRQGNAAPTFERSAKFTLCLLRQLGDPLLNTIPASVSRLRQSSRENSTTPSYVGSLTPSCSSCGAILGH